MPLQAGSGSGVGVSVGAGLRRRHPPFAAMIKASGYVRETANVASKCVDGKVIVVTGAGRGIGREIAMLAAAEGAKVVVNDLGGSAEGEGADVKVADQVVAEIKKAGGIAVSNGDSVADPQGAERIIKTAIDNFGRIDCVVNNAGILRDRIFHRMSAVDWDAVIKVHLYGAFYMSKAAAPYFKDQESGSFVHFTSTSGLVGNFGQANYAAAKLGIVGLSKSIALDMARFKVRSNCVSPFAWSRLIGTIPVDTPEQKARVERIQNTMTASKIAPICVFLASDLCQGRDGPDLRRAQGRDLPDEPVAPAARRPQGRRLDPASRSPRPCCPPSKAPSIRSTARRTSSTGSRL